MVDEVLTAQSVSSELRITLASKVYMHDRNVQTDALLPHSQDVDLTLAMEERKMRESLNSSQLEAVRQGCTRRHASSKGRLGLAKLRRPSSSWTSCSCMTWCPLRSLCRGTPMQPLTISWSGSPGEVSVLSALAMARRCARSAGHTCSERRGPQSHTWLKWFVRPASAVAVGSSTERDSSFTPSS